MVSHTRTQNLTGDEEQQHSGRNQELLQAGLLAYAEDDPSNGETHDNTEEAGDGDVLGLDTASKKGENTIPMRKMKGSRVFTQATGMVAKESKL